MRKLKLFFRKLTIGWEEVKYLIPDFFIYFFTKRQFPKEPSIIFVGTAMHGRIARITKWLARNSQFELLLICKNSGFSNKFINSDFTKVLTYRNSWHLKSILKKLDSQNVIFHSFGPPYQASKVLVNNIKFGKTIFDFQDLLVTNFGLNPPFTYMKREIKNEKYVLSEVDGIINHSLELQTAKKYYGTIAHKKLFFPIYTDNDQFVNRQKNNLDFENLHIVYIGGIMSAYRNKDYFGGLQIHWLIKKLNDQRIHFHVYPSPSLLKEHIIDYIELDKKLDYFHLHSSVSQKKLSSELANYDFGVLPFFHRTNNRLNDKRYYSTTLKMFNYFESGLPIILSEDLLFQNYMANKYGGGIKASWEDFDNVRELLKNQDYNQLLNNIKLNRVNLSLENNIHKILNFYKEL